MKILYLLHQYLPEHVGGVELYTHSLAQGMYRRGHTVSVFHRQSREGTGQAASEELYGTVHAVWNGPFQPMPRLLSTFRDPALDEAFARVLGQEQPDLVHVQHLMGLPVSLLVQLAEQHIPYVITLWDFWWVCANAQLLTNYSQEICEGPAAYLNCARCALARGGLPQFPPLFPPAAAPLAWRNHKLRQVLAGASRLIAPAAFVADWYADYGVERRQIEIVPPGINLPESPPLVKREPYRGQRPLRVGYVGGISSQKGVHVIVEAVRDLDDVVLQVAGDLTFDPAYADRLRRLAGTNTIFAGRLDRRALGRMLARIDLLAVTSLWYETFAFVISEAYAAGVPVLASDLGVLAERVDHGQDGLLLEPGNVSAWRQAVRQLRDFPGRLAVLRAGTKPPPSLSDHVEAIEQIYEAVR